MRLFLGWLVGVPLAVLALFNFLSLDAGEVFSYSKTSQSADKMVAVPSVDPSKPRGMPQ
jgi:hypothetical protein